MPNREMGVKAWIAVIVLVAVVLTYRVATLDLATMAQDQARDTHYAMRIAQGHEFPLFGPWMSIDPSARGSPIYYYLVAVGCFVGGTPFAAVVEMNVLWLLALIVAGVALRRFFGAQGAAFTIVFLLISPELLHMTDTVWNPYLLVTLSLLTFSFSLLFADSGKMRWWYAFILTGALCTHMHPLASLAALAFLPVVSLQNVLAIHKIASSALVVALAIPMFIGILSRPYNRLTVCCFAIYILIGPLIAIGHSFVRRARPALLAWRDRFSRLVWGLALGLSIYSIAKFGTNPSRPTLWLFALFALLNLVGKRRTSDTSREMARYIELPVVIIYILSFILMLAASLKFGAQPRAHYLSYAIPIVAVYVGLRLFDVLREGTIGFASVRTAALNRAIIIGTIVLLGFGHIYNHVSLVRNPYIFTFEGSKRLVTALLERFENDERLFDGRVFVYRKETGQDDEDCPMYTYYHLYRSRYAKLADPTRNTYVLIVNGWEAPKREYSNCFLSSPEMSAFEFSSMPEFDAFLNSFGLRAAFAFEDLWQVPFYVSGYTPEKWFRIALAND